MAEPITLRFTPTEQDYRRAARALAIKRGSLWVSVGMLSLLEVCLLFTLVTSSQPSPAYSWLYLLFPPLLIVLMFFVGPLLSTRSVKGNERLLAETTWQLSEEGVAMKNRFAESKLDWGSFSRLSEDPDYFFLQLSGNKRLHHFIPKRALHRRQRKAALSCGLLVQF